MNYLVMRTSNYDYNDYSSRKVNKCMKKININKRSDIDFLINQRIPENNHETIKKQIRRLYVLDDDIPLVNKEKQVLNIANYFMDKYEVNTDRDIVLAGALLARILGVK